MARIAPRAAPCGECGASANPLDEPGRTECATCGAATRPAERRVVTVLFADLAGYTTMSELLDPEEVHALVRPVMTGLRDLCEARRGVVPVIEGDGFMAVFGARAGREDEPVHALSAAVEMHQFLASRLPELPGVTGLHVGIHVGEVVVAPARETVGFSLSGDTVNIAARVTAQALAGQLLATAEVIEAVGMSEGWGPLEDVSLRGRESTVAVGSYDWGARGLPSGKDRWTGATAYVTRELPEAALRAQIRRGQSVQLVGEAGSGKSRLWRHVLEDNDVITATCSEHLYPRVRDLLAELVGKSSGHASPLVQRLLGAGAADYEDRSALVAGSRALSAGRSRVVVLDDAELLPDSELEALDVVLGASKVPWVVVSRQERESLALPSLVMPGLTPEEAERLLDALLPGASRELAGEVLRRAGDSPLYLEQSARLLLESGVVVVDARGTSVAVRGDLPALPTSMRLFVSSRLDLLPPDERDRLAVAAVLGDSLDVDLLCHLAACTLEDLEPLVDRGMLRWGTGASGLPELRFGHALVREVTYDSLLRTRRVDIHRAAAEWYAALPAAQVLEQQAFHLEAAVRLGDADCELVKRAVEALVVHARSVEEERTHVAFGSLERAREIAGARPECSIPRLQLDLASSAVHGTMGEFDLATVEAERAAAEARALGDEKATAEAALLLARAAPRTDRQGAVALYDSAEQLYAQLDDPTGLARVESERAMIMGSDIGLAQYVERLERAFQLAMRAGDRRLQASTAQALALHHAVASGRTDVEQWSTSAQSFSRADDVGIAPRLDLAAGVLAMYGGHPAEGLDAAGRALASGRSLGLTHVLTNSLTVNINLLVQDGQLATASRVLEEARELARTHNHPWWHTVLDLEEARLKHREGRVQAAADILARLDAGDAAAMAVLRRELHEVHAQTCLDRGDFGQARAHALEAALIDEQTGERCPSLRPRLIALIASLQLGHAIPLADIAGLKTSARETGLAVMAELATRWLSVDELTRGWGVDLHGMTQVPDVIECRALDLEIQALSSRRLDLLLEAAEVWGELGTTVWQARSLFWHSELTGTPHPEADELLAVLQSPAGLAETLRAQVRGLRT
jgi:class 3 adenylate cyclase